MRSTASRTAATLAARSGWSTTGRGLEDAARQQRLGRLKVEVLEIRPGSPRGERGVIALEDQTAVAKDPIGQSGSGAVELDQVDAAPGDAFDVGDQTAEGKSVERRTRAEPQRDIEVTGRAGCATGLRSEDQRIGNSGVDLEHRAERVHTRKCNTHAQPRASPQPG